MRGSAMSDVLSWADAEGLWPGCSAAFDAIPVYHPIRTREDVILRSAHLGGPRRLVAIPGEFDRLYEANGVTSGDDRDAVYFMHEVGLWSVLYASIKLRVVAQTHDEIHVEREVDIWPRVRWQGWA